jgi:hypothetical protein
MFPVNLSFTMMNPFKNFQVSDTRNRLVKEGKINFDDAMELKDRTDNLITVVLIFSGFALFISGLMVGYVIGRI